MNHTNVAGGRANQHKSEPATPCVAVEQNTRAVAQRAAAKLCRNSETAYALFHLRVRRPMQSSGEQAARMRRCICKWDCALKRRRRRHPVIARSPCDEAIHGGILDCFAALAMMLWTAPPERHQVPKRGRRSVTKREAVHAEVYQN